MELAQLKDRLQTKLQILETHVLEKKKMPGIDIVVSIQKWEATLHCLVKGPYIC